MCAALIHAVSLNRVVYACAWSDIDDVIDMQPRFEEVAKAIQKRATPAVCLDTADAVNTVRSFYMLSDSDED